MVFEARLLTEKTLVDVMLWIEQGGQQVWRTSGALGIPGRVFDLGDWIIQDAEGGFSSCRPDIFEATYDLVA